MRIRCLASGSTGNCYIVNSGDSCFILDAGIDIKKIINEVNLNDVDFAFISHEHNDHCKSSKKLEIRGVPVVWGNLPRVFEEIASMGLKQGNLKGYCFNVEHGESICSGLIAENMLNGESLLYITDFNICKPDLSMFKFTHIMVECNYCDDLIEGVEDFKTRRQINTHMGLKGLQTFLDGLDLSRCKEIILMHQSQTFGDAITMGATIYSKYRIRTGVCKQYGGIDYYG